MERMSSSQPPYFIGIALPPEVSEQISAFKWRLHREISHSLKPLLPHITLLHPSGLRGIKPNELLPKIREVAAPYLPLTISLVAVNDFEQEVLYLSVHAPKLGDLQLQLVGLLPTEAQETYRQRGYTPHVTLAQVRRPHTLNIESLRRRTEQEIELPCQIIVDSVSCFSQIHAREYHAHAINQ